MRASLAGTTSRRCPICQKSMSAHLYPGAGKMIEVDHCVACAGLWLDHQELEAIEQRASASALRPRPVPAEVPPGLEYYGSFEMAAEVDRRYINWSMYFFCLFTQLPLEVHAPRRVFPGVLLLLVLACLACYWPELTMSQEAARAFVLTFGLVPNQLSDPTQAYRLVSHAFLHAGPVHLIGNLFFLWIFGDNVHDVFCDHGPRKGPLMFLAFYLIAAVCGGLLHAAITLTRPNMAAVPLIGASGAVSGLMAAYWRLFPRSRLYQIFFFKSFKVPLWLYFGWWLLLNLLLAASLGPYSPISWEGHLGGFLAGFLLLEWFLPYPLARWRSRGGGESRSG